MTSSPLSADDLAVDRELADLAGGFRFLLDLTLSTSPRSAAGSSRTGGSPCSDIASSRTTPTWRPSGCRGPGAGRGDPMLASLLLAKQRELRLQLEMLASRGSEQFLALSIELYGAVTSELLADGAGHPARGQAAAAGSGSVARRRSGVPSRPDRAEQVSGDRARPRVPRGGARGQHRGDGLERRRLRSHPRAGWPSHGSMRCSNTRSGPTW